MYKQKRAIYFGLSIFLAMGHLLCAANTSTPSPTITEVDSTTATTIPTDKSQAPSRWIKGEEQYQRFSAEYKEGKFSAALKKLSDDVSHLLAEQPNLFKQTMAQAAESKAKIEQLNQANEAIWENGIQTLQQACKGKTAEPICMLIDSIAKNMAADKAFNAAFFELHSLAFAPEQQQNDSFTKSVVEVMQNEMKNLLYPMYSHQPLDQFNPTLPKAVEMQMLEQLQALAAKEPNHPLSAKIKVIVANYPAHFANFANHQTLTMLANGRIAPADSVEEQVQKIVQGLEQQRGEQLRKLFPMPTIPETETKSS